MNNTKIAITKLDAARRQLETAVILWFHDCDPISIHTLVAAAYEIILVLNRQRGGRSMMMDFKFIRVEHRKMLHDEFAKYAIFFKHGKRDPSATLHFPPQITHCFMLEAAFKYQEIAHQQLPLFQLFITYLFRTEPEIFGSNFVNTFVNTFSVEIDKLPKLGKQEFFRHILPAFTKIESA